MAKHCKAGSRGCCSAGPADEESFTPQEDHQVSSTSISTLVAEEPSLGDAGLTGLPFTMPSPNPFNSEPAGPSVQSSSFQGTPYGFVPSSAVLPLSYSSTAQQNPSLPMVGMGVPAMPHDIWMADLQQMNSFFDVNYTYF